MSVLRETPGGERGCAACCVNYLLEQPVELIVDRAGYARYRVKAFCFPAEPAKAVLCEQFGEQRWYRDHSPSAVLNWTAEGFFIVLCRKGRSIKDGTV